MAAEGAAIEDVGVAGGAGVVAVGRVSGLKHHGVAGLDHEARDEARVPRVMHLAGVELVHTGCRWHGSATSSNARTARSTPGSPATCRVASANTPAVSRRSIHGRGSPSGSGGASGNVTAR